jgi:hypothetical protein
MRGCSGLNVKSATGGRVVTGTTFVTVAVLLAASLLVTVNVIV